MSSLRVLIYGEGRHELGTHDGAQGLPEQLGALPRLVHRLLDNPESVEYECRSFKSVTHVPGKATNKFARKVKKAIQAAKLEGYDGVVVVIDRDCEPDRYRIGALRKGRDDMQADGYTPCAVGTAVEAFDAWMIADGKAIGDAGGNASISHPKPEKLDGKEGTGQHPKDRAARIFGGGRGLGQTYAAVAANVDIDLLKRRCPQGFAPFAEEVAEHLVPLVSAGGGG